MPDSDTNHNDMTVSRVAQTTPTQPRRHSIVLRGLESTPSSRSFEGRFGRMFRNLPVFSSEDVLLEKLAAKMIQPEEEDKRPGADDDDENEQIPAGYTYLGQFIDHDITFDPISSLQRQNDPEALLDFRTPRFDLDNLYGRGPDDQPYLYSDGIHLQLGPLLDTDSRFAGPDLPRGPNGRALIGDPRNDENVIISQLQSVFLRFHNKMVDRVATLEPPLKADDLLKEAQRRVRWHYQWTVVHDFLPRILGGKDISKGESMINNILRKKEYVSGVDGSGKNVMASVIDPQLLFYGWRNDPFIPVEFSVAAYRFGHSMIRPSYFFNDIFRNEKNPPFGRVLIFKGDVASLESLNGFRPLPRQWGFQWKYFFEMGEDSARPEETTFKLPQHSYKIDTELVRPLSMLPASVAHNPRSLAERNLKRGKALGIPSGQSVARAMAITPLTNKELGLDGDLAPLVNNTPLWFYILKEAEILAGGHHLGPVGGRIVAEVLLGLLAGDPLSYLSVEPNWTPDQYLARDGKFGMPELIKFAGEAEVVTDDEALFNHSN